MKKFMALALAGVMCGSAVFAVFPPGLNEEQKKQHLQGLYGAELAKLDQQQEIDLGDLNEQQVDILEALLNPGFQRKMYKYFVAAAQWSETILLTDGDDARLQAKIAEFKRIVAGCNDIKVSDTFLTDEQAVDFEMLQLQNMIGGIEDEIASYGGENDSKGATLKELMEYRDTAKKRYAPTLSRSVRLLAESAVQDPILWIALIFKAACFIQDFHSSGTIYVTDASDLSLVATGLVAAVMFMNIFSWSQQLIGNQDTWLNHGVNGCGAVFMIFLAIVLNRELSRDVGLASLRELQYLFNEIMLPIIENSSRLLFESFSPAANIMMNITKGSGEAVVDGMINACNNETERSALALAKEIAKRKGVNALKAIFG